MDSVMPPVQGALRVHPAPDVLPPLPREGEPGRNRFDDPQGRFRVRYMADTLRGCLVELMARWQEDQDAEQVLSAVEGLDEFGDEFPDPTSVSKIVGPHMGHIEWPNAVRKQQLERKSG